MDDLADLLTSVAPIVAATVGIVAGLVAIAKNFRKLSSLLATDQTQAIVEMKLLAATRLEMVNSLTAQLATERADHERTRKALDFARMSADDCERKLLAETLRSRRFLESRR